MCLLFIECRHIAWTLDVFISEKYLSEHPIAHFLFSVFPNMEHNHYFDCFLTQGQTLQTYFHVVFLKQVMKRNAPNLWYSLHVY